MSGNLSKDEHNPVKMLSLMSKCYLLEKITHFVFKDSTRSNHIWLWQKSKHVNCWSHSMVMGVCVWSHYLHRKSLEIDSVLWSPLVLFAPVESDLMKLILMITRQRTPSNHWRQHRKPGALWASAHRKQKIDQSGHLHWAILLMYFYTLEKRLQKNSKFWVLTRLLRLTWLGLQNDADSVAIIDDFTVPTHHIVWR